MSMFGNQQQVCSFYEKGICKYGDKCWNTHQNPSNNAFGGNSQPSVFSRLGVNHNVEQPKSSVFSRLGSATNAPIVEPTNFPEFITHMRNEIENWEGSGYWPFSVFAPYLDRPNIDGFEDMSREELRLDAYFAEKSNNVQQFQQSFSQKVDLQKSLRDAIKATSPEALEAMKKVYFADGKNLDEKKGLFGDQPSSFGSTGGSTFGASTTSSIFGASEQKSVFGGNAQNNAFGSKPVFGGNSQTSSVFSGSSQKSVFGGSGSTFGSSGSTFGNQNSIFGGKSPTQSTGFGGTQNSTFGSSNSNSTFSLKPSAFGKPNSGFGSGAFSSGATGQSTNAFGTASNSQTSVFGNASSGPTNAFGMASNAPSNAFGAASSTQTNAFGAVNNPQTSAFSAPTNAQPSIFGGTNNTQNSAFGSQQPSTFGGTPSVFGSGNVTKSVFGQNAFSNHTSTFGSQTTDSNFQNNNSFGGSSNNQATGGTGGSIFGSPVASTMDESNKNTNQPFGFQSINQTTNQNVFGGTTSKSIFGSGKSQSPEQIYTPLNQISSEDLKEFQNEEFTRIPICPPPQELCVR